MRALDSWGILGHGGLTNQTTEATMNGTCGNCDGTGQITFGVADGWDGREDCPACNGTGRACS